MDHFALGQRQIIDPLATIKKVYETYPIPRFEKPEFIWQLRYKKDSEQSFQTYFQKATHLVTHSRAYQTENTNSNFIYSRADEHASQWEGLYAYLPVLLFHMHQVVEALMKLVGRRAGQTLDVTPQRIEIGYVLWQQHSHWGDYGKVEDLPRLVETWDLAKLKCSECTNSIKASYENYLLFYHEGKVACGACSHENDLVAPFLELAEKELVKAST
jgi:hypothetical protein